MKARRALVASALLLLPVPFPAQSRAVAAGPLSGEWGGTLGNGTDGTPATFQLSVDSRGALSGVISGPKLTPGDAKGTYDAKSGAVKFAVTLRAEGATVIDFAGAISKDTLTAQANGDGGQAFTLRVVRGMKAPSLAVASGPQKPSDAALAAASRGFTEVSGWVARAAAMVPAEKYSYRPTASVRTFGELVGHLADSYTYYCARASGKEVQWSDVIEKGTRDKATLTTKLKQAQDACAPAYAKGQIGALIENVGHTNLHYGNIVTYMRMMGLTPPSS